MTAERRAELFAKELAHSPRYALASVLAQAAEAVAATEGIPYRDAHAHIRRLVHTARRDGSRVPGSRRIGRAISRLQFIEEKARSVIHGALGRSDILVQDVAAFRRALVTLTPLVEVSDER